MNSELSIQVRQSRSAGSLFRGTALALLGCILLPGCENPNATMPAAGGTGALIGAILGGTLGGGKWAAIGAAAGAGIGVVAGKIIYDKQKDLETRKKVLAASVADANKVLNDQREYNKYLETQIQKVKDQLQQISDAESKGEITPKQAKKLRQEMLPGIDSMSSEAMQTAETFQTYTKKGEADNADAQLVSTYDELKKQNADLDRMLESLTAQRNVAAAQ